MPRNNKKESPDPRPSGENRRFTDSINLVPIETVIGDYLVTKNGTFLLSFRLPSMTSVMGEGVLDGMGNNYAQAISQLPAGSRYQLSVISEPHNPIDDLAYFVNRVKRFEKEKNELLALPQTEETIRKIQQKETLAKTCNAMNATLTEHFDTVHPSKRTSFITIGYQIPIIQKTNIWGDPKKIILNQATLERHYKAANDYLIEQANLFISAFDNAGLPLTILTPEETLQTVWRVMHPMAENEINDHAQNMVLDMMQDHSIESNQPPTLEEFSNVVSATQLKQYLAPDLFDEYEDYLQIDGTYASLYIVHDYAAGRPAPLHQLNKLKGGWSASMYIEVANPEIYADILRKQEVQSKANNIARDRQGRIQDFSHDSKGAAAENARFMLETSGMLPVTIRFFLQVTAPNWHLLQDRRRALESELRTMGMKFSIAKDSQAPLWLNFIPRGLLNFPQKSRYMTAGAMANFYWPEVNNPTNDQGLYYGIDQATKVPIRVLPFGRRDEKTPVTMILGAQGSGKSVTQRWLMVSALQLKNHRVMAIDIEGDGLEEMCKLYGGRYIELGGNSGEKINLIDIPMINSDEDFNPLVEGTQHLVSCASAIIGHPIQPGDEFNALAFAYKTALQRLKWIDPESGKIIPGKWDPQRAPTLSNIVDALYSYSENAAAGRDMAKMLEQFATGIYADMFNVHTTIDISKENFVVFGLSKLNKTNSNTIKRVAMWQILTMIWTETLRRHEADPSMGNHIFIDEVWKFLEHDGGAKIIEDMARRLRKRRGSLNLATQLLQEFLNSREGNKILSLVGDYYLMRAFPVEANLITNKLKIPEYLGKSLPDLRTGQGIFVQQFGTVAVNLQLSEDVGVFFKKPEMNFD